MEQAKWNVLPASPNRALSARWLPAQPCFGSAPAWLSTLPSSLFCSLVSWSC